jgi:sec-independent protein translocase protein TatA
MKVLLFGGLGPTELVLILVIVLIIFGAGKLPQIGEALGKGIRNFKKASDGNEDLDVTPEEARPALESGDKKAAQPEVVEVEEVKAD